MWARKREEGIQGKEMSKGGKEAQDGEGKSNSVGKEKRRGHARKGN